MFEMLDYLSNTKPLEKYPWMLTKQFVLVTVENLAECIDACINGKNGRFALDLETTGLDNRVDTQTNTTKDRIVGVCLSGDGQTGWYIPLRHQNTRQHPTAASHNVPYMTFDREFRRLMTAVNEGRVVALFHNGKYDQEFLEFNGGEPFGNWDVPRHWEDTLILAYLRNSRARQKSLKSLAEASTEDPTQEQTDQVGGRGLGMPMFKLEELFPKPEKGEVPNYDFSLLDPSEEGPRIYGCSDAICTYLLAELLLPEVLQAKHGYNQKVIYTIEKLCSVATRWMERNRIQTSPAKVMELVKLGQQEWFDSVMTVYQAAEEILGRDVMPGYYKVLRYGSPEDGQGKFVPDNPLCLLPQQIEFAKSREARWYRNPVGSVESQGKTWPCIYDVNAPQQLGKMFEEMAVPGLKYTELSGQVMTAKAELERVIEEAADRFPFMGKIRRFRETNKALSSYLYPMLEDVDPVDHTMRINFVGLKVDTGRYSTPAKERELGTRNDRRMPGWPEINLQSMPATYDPKRPACMTRLRECVVARPGFFIVAIDFSGEELRLVTNLSGEPKWLEEFFHCSSCNRKFNRGDGSTTPAPPPARCPNCGSDKIGDLHTLTALGIYGQDAPQKDNWKALRGYAKATNFALCYGGGGNAVVNATRCDKNEGWRIKNQFDATYAGLKQWWGGQHKFANKHGFVLTAFGRIYPVPDIWSADGGFRSKAERNSVNGPIQGTGADIIKIAMGVIYKEVKKRGWLPLVRMIATMHDELVFEMHGSIIEEAIGVITPLMTSNPLIMGMKWPIPLTADCEMGHDWTVSWNLNEMLYREVRFDGSKKVKEPKKPQRDDPKYLDDPAAYQKALDEYPAKKQAWADLPHTWPAELRPLFKISGQDGGEAVAVEATPAVVEIEAEPVVAEIAPSAVVPAPAQTVHAQTPPLAKRDLPKVAKNGTYDFVLKGELTPGMCSALAEVIQSSEQGGFQKLRLMLPDGTELTGWSDTDHYVIPDKLYWLAESRGL